MGTSTPVGTAIGISAGHAVAVVSTCFRLAFKVLKQRLWWDDFWALISLAVLIAQWISSVDQPRHTTPHDVRDLWVISYQSLYLLSLWAARLSLAVIIVRLCPEGTMRMICKIIAVLFGLAAFGLIAYKTIQCGLGDKGGVEFCAFDTLVAVVETSCDILADSWLVGAPIHMLCRMKLPRRHLRMLVAIFTLNILTSFASIAHSVLSLLHREGPSFIAGNAQCATSLFVCNLLVLVTFLYRRIRGNEEETTFTEPAESVTQGRTTRQLTGSLQPARIELAVVSMGRGRTMSTRANLWLPPVPCDLSPSSTFPDLPPRRRRVETNKSQTECSKCASLPAPPCPSPPTDQPQVR